MASLPFSPGSFLFFLCEEATTGRYVLYLDNTSSAATAMLPPPAARRDELLRAISQQAQGEPDDPSKHSAMRIYVQKELSGQLNVVISESDGDESGCVRFLLRYWRVDFPTWAEFFAGGVRFRTLASPAWAACLAVSEKKGTKQNRTRSPYTGQSQSRAKLFSSFANHLLAEG